MADSTEFGVREKKVRKGLRVTSGAGHVEVVAFDGDELIEVVLDEAAAFALGTELRNRVEDMSVSRELAKQAAATMHF